MWKCGKQERRKEKNSQTFLIDQANEEERDWDLSDNEKQEKFKKQAFKNAETWPLCVFKYKLIHKCI